METGSSPPLIGNLSLFLSFLFYFYFHFHQAGEKWIGGRALCQARVKFEA